MDLSRLADSLPRPRLPRKTGLAALTAKASAAIARVKRAITGTQPLQDDWGFARGRFNTLVFTRLRDVQTDGQLAVACYHMPCAFQSPAVMTIHAALAAQKALGLAAGTPLVLAGDFNFKPSDPQYKMYVTGAMDASDVAYPSPPPGAEPFRAVLPAPLRSAYAEANGGAEPDFSNMAQVKDEPMFVDVLDYIFVSDGVQVLTADVMPHRSAVAGPLPNADEPSDHLLVAATLRV